MQLVFVQVFSYIHICLRIYFSNPTHTFNNLNPTKERQKTNRAMGAMNTHLLVHSLYTTANDTHDIFKSKFKKRKFNERL